MRRLLKLLGKVLLFLIIAICLAPSAVPPFLDRIYYRGAPSDHFDGERFFNPGSPPYGGSPSRFISRFASSSERAEWPEEVPVRQTVPPRRIDGSEMRVTWIGHATVLVQTQGLNILTDPVWSDVVSPFPPIGPRRVRAPGVKFEKLPKIDLVVISHNHYDHLDLPTLKRLWERDRPLIVTSLGNDTILRGRGIGIVPEGETSGPPVPSGVQALDWGDGISMTPPCVAGARSCPATIDIRVQRNHHWSSRWGTDRNRALWSGFTVRLPGGNIFFAGDTGLGDGSWVREAARSGPFRLAIIPIGAYEPRDFMETNHVNPEEAVRIFETLRPAQALGMHWGTFQLTFEPIDEPRQKLEALKRQRGIAPGRFIAVEPGESFRVPSLSAPAGFPR